MAKSKFDTTVLPETITAPYVKRFFKDHFQIPVRVQGSSGRHYMDVWIPSDRSDLHKLVYHHAYPAELGNRCMRVVYSGSESLSQQNWGGNVRSNSIAMHMPQWRVVLQTIIDHPIERATT